MVLFYVKQTFLLLGYCLIFSLGSIFISAGILRIEVTLISTAIGEVVGIMVWTLIMLTQTDIIGSSKALVYAMIAAAVSGAILAFTEFQVSETSQLLTNIGFIVFSCCAILVIIVALWRTETFIPFIGLAAIWIIANILIAAIPMFTPSVVYNFLTMQQ